MARWGERATEPPLADEGQVQQMRQDWESERRKLLSEHADEIEEMESEYEKISKERNDYSTRLKEVDL